MGESMIARVFPRRTRATPDDPLAFVDCQPPLLTFPDVDEIHVSVVFAWDFPKAERLAEEWRAVGVPVKMGGPAFDQPGEEFIPGLYVKRGITITSRGCPNHCWFCAVPKREGGLRELRIQDGWNVLDDNLLACSDAHVEAVFEMLDRQPQRAIFTGGLEARILKPWHARRLREIKAKRMYFAYDTPDDYDPLVQAGKIMQQEGHRFASHSMACYCLIGHNGDTFDMAEKRLVDTVKAGYMPYAMLYRGPDGSKDPDWGRFQREWLRPEILGKKVRAIRGET
ncbi:MAG: hypothetical protein GXY67_10390 [Clostridiales bacterium]|nr:hypothetical protein [Clostridiales bacterium]